MLAISGRTTSAAGAATKESSRIDRDASEPLTRPRVCIALPQRRHLAVHRRPVGPVPAQARQSRAGTARAAAPRRALQAKTREGMRVQRVGPRQDRAADGNAISGLVGGELHPCLSRLEARSAAPVFERCFPRVPGLSVGARGFCGFTGCPFRRKRTSKSMRSRPRCTRRSASSVRSPSGENGGGTRSNILVRRLALIMAAAPR